MKARTAYFLLIFLCLSLFLPGLSTLPVMDRDEAHFAQATRQMMQSGNYFSTQFLNITRHQKSPAINWLQAASVEIFSTSESNSIWPYRLPSFLGALVSVLLLFYFVNALFDVKTAFLTSVLMASCVLLVLEAHIAVIDSCLLATIIAMQGALWKIYCSALPSSRGKASGSIFARTDLEALPRDDGRVGKRHFLMTALIFWLSMSAGFFLKGLAPLMAFLTIGALCFVDRNIQLLKSIHILPGLTLFILSTLLWVIPTSIANHGNYLLQLFQHDLLPKLTHGVELHGEPPGYYLAIFSILFFPGSLFAGFAIRWACLNRQENTERFLLAWIIPTWLFFAIMPTKLPQYLLPLLPPVAILSARGILNISWKNTSKIFRSFQYFQAIFWLAIGIAIVLLPFLLARLTQNTLSESATMSGALLLFALLIALILFFYNRYQACLYWAIFGMIFSFATLSTEILPHMHNFWLSQKILQQLQVQKLISEKNPLITIDYDEPSLGFYLGLKKMKIGAELNTTNPYLISEEKLHEKRNFPIKIITSASAYNYSLGKWETYYVVLRQYGPKSLPTHPRNYNESTIFPFRNSGAG